MSTETYADVEDIQKDGEEATDKILNIRVPVKQHSGSSVGSRRSSVGHVSAIKQRFVEKEQRAGLGRKGVGEEKDKNGKVQFEAVKETGRQKIKSRIRTKEKKGIRPGQVLLQDQDQERTRRLKERKIPQKMMLTIVRKIRM